MNTTIKKWGNSLALRIPKSFAKEIKLEEGAAVDLKIEENKIIILPKRKREKKYSLKELVSKITPENVYKEIDFGPPVGKEIF
jgi:antitoxin MazE